MRNINKNMKIYINEDILEENGNVEKHLKYF